MAKRHDVASSIVWTADRGEGTRAYRGYDRTWDIALPRKEIIYCSNDPLLGGDPAKMNPEDLPLSALSACHMLRYLHLASSAGIVVVGYRDDLVWPWRRRTWSLLPNCTGKCMAFASSLDRSISP